MRVVWLPRTGQKLLRGLCPFTGASKEYHEHYEFPCREVTSWIVESYNFKRFSWLSPSACLTWVLGLRFWIGRVLKTGRSNSLWYTVSPSRKRLILKSKTINWIPFSRRPGLLLILLSTLSQRFAELLPSTLEFFVFCAPVNASEEPSPMEQGGVRQLTPSIWPFSF